MILYYLVLSKNPCIYVNCDRVWSKNCHEKKKEIRKDVLRLIKIALAPLPIYRTWTNKSEEKTLRLEKEIVMLRQLLDNAIPDDANNYLTLVSESLREIEKVCLSKYFINSKYFLYGISICSIS